MSDEPDPTRYEQINVAGPNDAGPVYMNGAALAPLSALVMTTQEWDDLAQMLRTWEARQPLTWPTTDAARRQCALAERIIEANQP